MRISDWSSDVCSSDLDYGQNLFDRYVAYADAWIEDLDFKDPDTGQLFDREVINQELTKIEKPAGIANPKDRSEEHTSELQSLMRISYAVFCLKKKNPNTQTQTTTTQLKKHKKNKQDN